MKKDYSIECVRSYSDNSDDTELLSSLKGIIKKTEESQKTHSLVLLVDDITHDNKSFDFEAYGNWLSQNGYKEAVIYRESDILSACEEVVKLIDYSKIDEELGSVLKNKIFTSSLFIASWCLLRLGCIEVSGFSTDLQSNKIYNIVPVSFKEGESEALLIIKATPFDQAVDQIEYCFV